MNNKKNKKNKKQNGGSGGLYLTGSILIIFIITYLLIAVLVEQNEFNPVNWDPINWWNKISTLFSGGREAEIRSPGEIHEAQLRGEENPSTAYNPQSIGGKLFRRRYK